MTQSTNLLRVCLHKSRQAMAYENLKPPTLDLHDDSFRLQPIALSKDEKSTHAKYG